MSPIKKLNPSGINVRGENSTSLDVESIAKTITDKLNEIILRVNLLSEQIEEKKDV
jgi:hypothetical protein